MFALRFKKGTPYAGQLVSVYARSDYEDSNVEYMLSSPGASIWVVHNRDHAERAAVTNAEWYNASYTTPSNEYVGQLEVVELKVV